MTITLSHLSLWTVLVAVAIIGAGPVVAMRILRRAWPKDHLRRQELVAEVKALPYRDRVFFVAEMLEAALVEGLPQRSAESRQQATRLLRSCRASVATFKTELQARLAAPLHPPTAQAQELTSVAGALFLLVIVIAFLHLGHTEGADEGGGRAGAPPGWLPV